MILVADSGSTKTDWILVSPGETDSEYKTIGINPFFLSDKEMLKLISKEENLVKLADDIKEVYFFGAGCSSPDKREVVSNVLSQVFKNAYISVDSDLLGSAYATSGNEKGLCCILGTGSNVTYFDGENIFEGKHGLGYILGDEGSGSYFGKKLLTDYLYGKMPEDVKSLFLKSYTIDKEVIISHVYHKPRANYYLASFASFLGEIKNTNYGKNIIYAGLTEFVSTNITGYPSYQNLKCHFVGSVAWNLKDELQDVCAEHEIKVGNIVKKPIHDLVKFLLKRE